MNGSRYLPSSMSVLHSTQSIMLSYSIVCPFRSGSRDQHLTGCVLSSWVGRKQFTTVGPSRSALLCVPVWLKDRCLDLSSTSSTLPTSRSWSNHLGAVFICIYIRFIQTIRQNAYVYKKGVVRISLSRVYVWRRPDNLKYIFVQYTINKVTGSYQTDDAADTQFHGSCKVSEAADLAGHAMRIVNEIKIWMSSNRLRLNADKTQFIWLDTGHFLGRRDMQAIDAILSSTDVVNNLGVYLDSELTLERQVGKLCQVCYFHLRRLRTVRRSLSKESLRTLVHAFIISRVYRCNGLLYGSYSYLLDRLQSVLNSAARLVLNIAKFSGISTAIRDELHWLPIRKRIDFKIALLVRHCMVGAALEYLMELCRPVSSAAGRQSLRSASQGDPVIPRFRLRTFGYQAFAVTGPQLWNSLPLDVRQSHDNLLGYYSKRN